jgi:hypothetical protein
VQAHKRLEILDWVGKVAYDDDYEPKRLRKQEPVIGSYRHYYLVALARILYAVTKPLFPVLSGPRLV